MKPPLPVIAAAAIVPLAPLAVLSFGLIALMKAAPPASPQMPAPRPAPRPVPTPPPILLAKPSCHAFAKNCI